MSLELKNVTKKYGDKIAVNNLSINIKKGQMFGFLGRNGAGKTTTFRMILGLAEPSEGTILYNKNIIDKKVYNKIGYLPEERGLHSNLTVFEELKYLSVLKGVNHNKNKKIIDEWLNKFQVTELKFRKIKELSKGNQQKIQLISCILHNPELLILDEPFSGLDPVNVEILKAAILELNRKGTTIIFSSHRMEHVEELCEEICILDKGEIKVSGNLKTIKSQSKNKKILIETVENIPSLNHINGILSVNKKDNLTSINIDSDIVAIEVFKEIKKLNNITKFEVVEPTLNEIFINKVGVNNG